MSKIELRKDGWFEAGKDAKKDFPVAYLAYQVKQELKKKLLGLNKKNLSLSKLETELSGIDADSIDEKYGAYCFRGSVYLRGTKILIDTQGPPGEAYLGEVRT